MIKRARSRYVLAACVAVTASLSLAQPAASQRVDLELVLAVDVSGSMDVDEHELQRMGYVEALRHPQVAASIGSGFRG